MNIIISIISMLALVLGFISLVTPIPGGTLFIAGGLTGLICSNARARLCVKWLRTRFNWFNKMIAWLDKKVGTRIKLIGTALQQTTPDPMEANEELPSHKDFIKKHHQDQ